MSKIEARLAELGITLPEPPAAIATYVGFVRTGNLVHVSGQVSTDASGGIKGTVGVDVDLETAQQAARLCAVNIMAQLKAAVGDLDNVVRIVKLCGVQHRAVGQHLGELRCAVRDQRDQAQRGEQRVTHDAAYLGPRYRG